MGELTKGLRAFGSCDADERSGSREAGTGVSEGPGCPGVGEEAGLPGVWGASALERLPQCDSWHCTCCEGALRVFAHPGFLHYLLLIFDTCRSCRVGHAGAYHKQRG